jgi:hypothetical protein
MVMTRERDRRRDLERSWAAWMAQEQVTSVRADVLASWQLSRSASHPEISEAPLDGTGEAVRRWEESAVHQAASTVFDRLRSFAEAEDFVAAITDADGVIVWSHGGRQMQRKAERINFVRGGRWDERSAGTNALGLALRTGQPAEVWSAEHFCRMVHNWVCYSAPIVSPSTGRVLGVVDISSTWERRNPLGLVTVTSMAQCVNLVLSAQSPASPVPHRHALVMRGLGRQEALLEGRKLLLSPRQFEMATILSLFPEGLTLDQLHTHLYGDRDVHPGTTKSEASHLRAALQGAVLSRPYRLAVPTFSDHDALIQHLEHGRLEEALDLYHGPLLPLSESPVITERRHYVDVALRTAVLNQGDPYAMLAFIRRHSDDEWVLEQLLTALTPADPRRSLVVAQIAVLNDLDLT